MRIKKNKPNLRILFCNGIPEAAGNKCFVRENPEIRPQQHAYG